MATEEASNYHGKGGRVSIKPMGQTDGPFGNDHMITGRNSDKGDPKNIKP